MRVLERILEGARFAAEEAGISIIGGHTVDDTEPKYGLTVTGVADPGRIVTNRGARAGDRLVLTKPVGTGILATAMKQGLIEAAQAEALVETMALLNRAAAEAMQEIGVNSCTDITGFGLLGHLLEMMNGSGTSAQVYADRVPLLPGAQELAASGVVPGGTRNNLDFTSPYVKYDARISIPMRLVLNDAQTSGGLLISVSEEKSLALLALLVEKGVKGAQVVGRVIAEGELRIEVVLDR